MSKFYNFSKAVLILLTFGLSTFVSAQCDIDVTVSSAGWGDFTSWELQDGDGAVVLSGGPYGQGYTDNQTTMGFNPPYALVFTINNSAFCDNEPDYVVTVGGAADISGTVLVGCVDDVVTIPLMSTFDGCTVVMPPAPTQDFPTVSCATGTDLSISGTPALNNVWYWQTSALGTSMANAVSGSFTVYANGTYYVRSYNTVTMIWSDASSVVVNDFPLYTTPPTPVADQSPACNATQINVAPPPTQVAYFWQGTTPNGTDDSNLANVPYDVTSTGDYHLTAYDSVSQCWSNSSSVFVEINSTLPNVPTSTTASHNICSGLNSFDIEAVSNITFAQTTLIGTNLESPGTLVSFPVTVPALPLGANVVSANLVLTDVNSINGSWRSEIRVALSDMYTLGATQISTLTSSGLVTPNPYSIALPAFPSTGGNLVLELSETFDDGGTIDATYGSVALVINYTMDANLNWYDAASAGNLLGSGSPWNCVGNSVLADPTTNGIYEFYGESEYNSCTSASRLLVTVNVNSVNVELLAIDATCNNQANGSFAVTDTLCGQEPFQYSIDGGAFGPLPTDLLAGTHTVEVMDDLGEVSIAYTITINDAQGPSLAYMETITDNGGQISWTANGSETQWYVEWGLPGFTPGTGNEIGSADALDTFFLITGLDANTNYDVYVSANCGATETVGTWDMVNFTTDCAMFAIPFNETFETSSESRDCWVNVQEVGAANWTYNTGSSGGLVTTAYEGSLNARFVSQNNTNSPITKLVSPRFDLTGQDSVALVFAYAQESWGTQNITKVYVSSQTSGWTEIQSYNSSVDAWTLDTLYLSDSVYQFAFEGINNWGRANVLDDVQLLPCNLNPGTDGMVDVCRIDSTVNLNAIITKGEDFGRWYFANESFIINDSIADFSLLPAGTHEFYYIVQTPCAIDTTTAFITVFNASTAGEDGTINVCMNEPFDLYSGLVGLVDHGGTWYDPSNNPISGSQLMASSIPGQFNYDYIVSNGVCGPDTANVVVNVSPSCDWLNIAELGLESFDIYPNPTSGMIYITNEGSKEVFSYVLTDLNGKVIANAENAINGTDTTPLDLNGLEPGVYLIKVANDNLEHTFRIIKQ